MIANDITVRRGLALPGAVVLATMVLAGCGGSTHTVTVHTPTTPTATTPTRTTVTENAPAETSGPPSCESTGFSGSECVANDGTHFKVAHGRGTLQLGSLSARLNGVTVTKTVSNGPGFSATAHGEFVVISMTVTNKSHSPQSFSDLGTQTVLHVGQNTYTEDFHAANGNTANSFVSKDSPIQPGESDTGNIVFDVPSSVASGITSNPQATLVLGNFGDDLSQPLPSTLGLITLEGTAASNTGSTNASGTTASLPTQCSRGLAATHAVSCGLASNTFYEYYKAVQNGKDTTALSVWSPVTKRYYTANCSKGNAVITCDISGTGDPNAQVQITQDGFDAYTPQDASAYARNHDLGPRG